MEKAKIIQFPGCTPSPEVHTVHASNQTQSPAKRVTMWADVMKIVAYSIQICYLISLLFHK
ncbi:hypothetical protein [Paenibacillus sp. GP183]|uniref:hypothetical protein n=1 Tax=Paenibacillus sp. GP183 TaxID=1882751 RepID=UPI000895258D|nr:hypothetical protein [Paenibacillus sp. GP183]SEC09910.1 hypothetical protein SAMN05443246_2964 [Paenibacillus sp. GP183]